MIIRGMNLSLIFLIIFIIIALIIFPLIISYKAEEKKDNYEWDKIKEYGNKINTQNKNKKVK